MPIDDRRGQWRALTRAEQRAKVHPRAPDRGRRPGVLPDGASKPAPIDVIAEEAGYSRGAFYSNFDSKDELFVRAARASPRCRNRDADSRAGSHQGRPRTSHRRSSGRYRVLGEDSSWCLLATEFQLYSMRGGRMGGTIRRNLRVLPTPNRGVDSGPLRPAGNRIGVDPHTNSVVAQIAPCQHGLALQRAANTALKIHATRAAPSQPSSAGRSPARPSANRHPRPENVTRNNATAASNRPTRAYRRVAETLAADTAALGAFNIAASMSSTPTRAAPY